MGEVREIPEVPKRPRKFLMGILLIAIVGIAAVSVFIWWHTQKAPSPVNLVWAKTYGSSESDQATSIVECGDGGFIVAGNTYYSAGAGDIYLLKIDGDGNKIWEKTYGGSEDDWATSIVQSGDGVFIVAGGTYSFGAGATDIYLLKIDADGDKVWEKTYGGDNKEEAYSIVECGDGGFIVGASTRPTFEDVYFLKIDGNGNKVWEKTYGGKTGSDYCYSVVQSGDGGFIMTGNTYSFGAGAGDVYLLKIDGNGKIVWQKAYGGSEYDEGSFIIQCGDSEFIVAGTSHGDFYLLKISVSN